MSAGASFQPTDPDPSRTRKKRQLVRAALRKEHIYRPWLEAVEVRLGTPDEQPLDHAVALFLAHKLANIVCCTQLAKSLDL